MPIEPVCSTCRQTLFAKHRIWQVVAQHLEGCPVNLIAQITGYPKAVVQEQLNDLFVEDKVYTKKGKWYPEMAVSLEYHFL